MEHFPPVRAARVPAVEQWLGEAALVWRSAWPVWLAQGAIATALVWGVLWVIGQFADLRTFRLTLPQTVILLGLVTAGTALVLPGMVFSALKRHHGQAPRVADLVAGMRVFSSAFAIQVLAGLLVGVISFCLLLVIFYVISAMALGAIALAISVPLGLLALIALLLALLGLVLISLAIPALVAEHAGAVRAVRRSVKLVCTHLRDVILLQLPILALASALAALTSLLNTLHPFAALTVGFLVSVVTAPWLPIAQAIAYEHTAHTTFAPRLPGEEDESLL